MPFNRTEVDELLVACHRRCCICHRFCGVKIETDHIIPTCDGGGNEIENAIPVCFECHAEIHSYNDQHPRGRKFRAEELQAHKEQWLRICREQPHALVDAARSADVGPLQALLDELAFNEAVSRYPEHNRHGCRFYDQQFHRAIEQGGVAILRDDLRNAILEAYVLMGRANNWLTARTQHHPNSDAGASTGNRATDAIREAAPKIAAAEAALLKFLGSETLDK